MLVRHAGLCVAMIIAYVIRESLVVGSAILWGLGTAAALNLLSSAALTSRSAPVQRIAFWASPSTAVASWATLVALSGGATRSPFTAGLWLEVGLSTLISASSIVFVTAAGALALAVQQAVVSPADGLGALAIPIAFLVAMGGVALVARTRWDASQRSLARHLTTRDERMREVIHELEDVRAIAQASTETATLSHGIKNALHSMRGFTELIAADGVNASREALEGLRRSMDRVEALVADSLKPVRTNARKRLACAPDSARETLERTAREVRTAFPRIRIDVAARAPNRALTLSCAVLGEIVQNLLVNAAESMGGRGRVAVEALDHNDSWELRVSDEGRGVAPAELERVFRPGYSTKEEGSGVGLFLCRRWVESGGGQIAVVSHQGNGATFTVTVPLFDWAQR